MAVLTIYLIGDKSDLDWLRERAVPAVEEVVDENESRLDGKVEVGWEYEDEA